MAQNVDGKQRSFMNARLQNTADAQRSEGKGWPALKVADGGDNLCWLALNCSRLNFSSFFLNVWCLPSLHDKVFSAKTCTLAFQGASFPSTGILRASLLHQALEFNSKQGKEGLWFSPPLESGKTLQYRSSAWFWWTSVCGLVPDLWGCRQKMARTWFHASEVVALHGREARVMLPSSDPVGLPLFLDYFEFLSRCQASCKCEPPDRDGPWWLNKWEHVSSLLKWPSSSWWWLILFTNHRKHCSKMRFTKCVPLTWFCEMLIISMVIFHGKCWVKTKSNSCLFLQDFSEPLLC